MTATTPTATRPSPLLHRLPALPLLVALWLTLRVAFFEGLWGYDDLYHVHFALDPGAPRDVWEARLLYNALLIGAYALFGHAEWTYALPTLLASLALLLVVYFTARRLYGPGAAFTAGLLVAAMPHDVVFSTDPMANPLAVAFAAAGTALVLTGDDRRRTLLAGAAFGAAVSTHLSTALYFGPMLVACALTHERPRALRRAAALAGTAFAAFALIDGTLFWLVAGDPLGRLALVTATHLEIQEYTVPPFLPSGAWNPEWFTWPVRELAFSKQFGFLLSAPLVVAALRWRRLDRTGRFLAATLFGGWLYINFGTQHPLDYAPLNHQWRYWHPLAVPACLLAVHALGLLRRRAARAALLAVVLAPWPVALLASGPWGQNVEITRELIAYAHAHPDRTFVTDPYTYDEMVVLGELRAPPNVTLFTGPPGDEPVFGRPPPETRPAMGPGDYLVLVNRLNFGRPKSARFERFVRAHLEVVPVTPPAWRAIARLLPAAVRRDHPWLVRKPPAEVGRFAGRRTPE